MNTDVPTSCLDRARRRIAEERTWIALYEAACVAVAEAEGRRLADGFDLAPEIVALRAAIADVER